MAWTTPKNWSAILVTVADLNTHIRDNLNALKTPPQDIYSTGAYAGANTTSSTFVNIDATNLSLDITTTGGRIAILLQVLVYATATAQRAYFDISINGSRIGDTSYGLGNVYCATAGERFTYNLFIVTGAQAAGSYNVKPMWLVNSGGTINLGANVLFHIWES